MFKRSILGMMVFFCTAFQFAFAHTSNNYFENQSNNRISQEVVFSVDANKLFLESGQLFFDSDYKGAIPLTSIDYHGDRCYTKLSLEVLKGDYMQGYQCNKCGYIKIKTSPGSPGSCPVCGNNDWTLM